MHESTIPRSTKNARKRGALPFQAGELALAVKPGYPPGRVFPEPITPNPDADAQPKLDVSTPETPKTARKPLLAALITTLVVTALSYLTPSKHAATAVGLAFLGATWFLVLRKDEHEIRAHGLSLGGLLEPLPLERKRLLKDAAIALAWVLALAAIVFPAFWFGFKIFWHVKMHFVFRWPKSPVDEIAGQLLVVALPEEAFFRGYLQTELEAAWPRRIRVFGTELGLGWLVSAMIFAVGHVLTTPVPARLAVFFPALLFGLLRTRTGGIGAGVLFHALCNLFSAFLARGYGLST